MKKNKIKFILTRDNICEKIIRIFLERFYINTLLNSETMIKILTMK